MGGINTPVEILGKKQEDNSSHRRAVETNAETNGYMCTDGT